MTQIPDTSTTEPAGVAFVKLVELMRTLRSPSGCPWDREQTLSSLRPFVLEEAYEVVDAIDRGDTFALRDELGDLVFEAVFLAQLCAEQEAFTIADALTSVTTKLVRRHPHVFGDTPADRDEIRTAEDVKRKWEAIKAEEQAAAGQVPRLLGSIPTALPALLRAYRIGKRAATVGFDWSRPDEVLSKVDEELGELREAIGTRELGPIEEELGDLLFALANLARHLSIEPEAALSRATRKFTERFTELEHFFEQQGRTLREASADEMDAAWQQLKTQTRG